MLVFMYVMVTSHFSNICPATYRSTLSSHWVNFHDPESDLLDMEWWAGTSPGHGDILSPTRLHVTDKVTVNLTDPLPLGRRIYVTLKVFNRAGRTDHFLVLLTTLSFNRAGRTDHFLVLLTTLSYNRAGRTDQLPCPTDHSLLQGR